MRAVNSIQSFRLSDTFWARHRYSHDQSNNDFETTKRAAADKMYLGMLFIWIRATASLPLRFLCFEPLKNNNINTNQIQKGSNDKRKRKKPGEYYYRCLSTRLRTLATKPSSIILVNSLVLSWCCMIFDLICWHKFLLSMSLSNNRSRTAILVSESRCSSNKCWYNTPSFSSMLAVNWVIIEATWPYNHRWDRPTLVSAKAARLWA